MRNGLIKGLFYFLLITLPVVVVTGGGVITFKAVSADSIAVSRDIPESGTVTAGNTFQVTITFNAPADNFNSIVIHDEAPAGWEVTGDKSWCMPAAQTVKTYPPNGIEYSWLGPFGSGQSFTVVYEIKVPAGVTGDSYSLHSGWLVYYIAGEEHQSAITGESSVEVKANPQTSGGDDIPVTSTTDTPSAGSPTTPIDTETKDEKPAVTVTTARDKVKSQNHISIRSSDERIKLTLAEGTIALTGDNLPVSEITVDELPEPPGLPGGGVIAGPIYSLGPEGATFTPALNLSMHYDTADIPPGFAEEKLVISYWSARAGKWINMDSLVNTDTKTVTAPVTHFTVFSILAYAENAPSATYSVKNITLSRDTAVTGEQVTVFALITNDVEDEQSYEVTMKVNDVVERSQEVTLTAGEIKMVSFATSKDTIGTYIISIGGFETTLKVISDTPLVPPELPAAKAKPFNWTIIYVIAGGLLVIIVVVVLVMLKRRMD